MTVISVMTCLPMSGKTSIEVMRSKKYTEDRVRHRIIDDWRASHITPELNYLSQDIDVKFCDNYMPYHHPLIDEESNDHGLYCLGNGISTFMPHVQYVVFGEEWEKSRGCLMEAIIAWSYGKKIFAYTGNKFIRDFDVYKIAVNELQNIVIKNEMRYNHE